MTAAAGGDARVFLGSKRGRKRAEAKEENEEDGKNAPHLGFIVHDGWPRRNGSGNQGDAVSYHRDIQ